MVSSATAYSIFMKVQGLHASKSEECEKEGTNFSLSMNLSKKQLDIIISHAIIMCVSDRLVRLWLRCDFSTLRNAKILFHTRTHMHFSCRQQNRIKILSPYHLWKVRN